MTKRTRFAYMGYLMVASMDCTQNTSNPPLVGTWFWDPSEPVATRVLAMCTHNVDKSVSFTRYAAHGLLKSVSALFDSSGTRQAKFEYTPYGETLTTEGAWASSMPFRYSSEYRDEDLGLIYYNYRHYSPQDGRWISRDPVGEKGGELLYHFGKNAPVYSLDSLGLNCRGIDYLSQESDVGHCVYGFYDPMRESYAIDRSMINELNEAIEKANSIKDSCGNQCYMVFLYTNPINNDAVRTLPWGYDLAILMSHTSGYPDEFKIYIGEEYYAPISSNELNENVDVRGCHLAGRRDWNRPGGVGNIKTQKELMRGLIDQIKSLSARKCCDKMETILLVTGKN